MRELCGSIVSWIIPVGGTWLITLLVGEKLCCINNNKHLTTLEWPIKILTTLPWSSWCSDTIAQYLCWNSPWWWRYKHFVVSSAAIPRSLSSTLVASTALRRPHKVSDHTAVTATVHWCLHAKTHCAGEVVSSVISSCLTFGRHCWLDRQSMVLRDMIIGMSCNT